MTEKTKSPGKALATEALGAETLAGRAAGILLPVFSLPSPHGVGTLGRAAYEFADFLKSAGQRIENLRIVMQGQSFSIHGPNGSCATFTRMAAPQPQTQPGPGATPLEGRWFFARPGPVSVGYVFSSGRKFVYLRTGAPLSSGTFQMTAYQITFRHDSGQTVSVGYQLYDNRLVIFTSEDPNNDPISFVRQ